MGDDLGHLTSMETPISTFPEAYIPTIFEKSEESKEKTLNNGS